MSTLGDNTSASNASVDENSNKSSQDTNRRSQQWLEAEDKNENMNIEFSDDEDYELTRLTPSIEKAIRLSILSIGKDSDLDSEDDSDKKEEKQKKRKRDDEVSLNESHDRKAIASISDENSMDNDHVQNTSYNNMLEPVKKKIKLDELDVPQDLQDKCAEILNNSQEIKNFLEETPKNNCRKILKVKLFKPDQKMQLLINRALQRSKDNYRLSEYLENKENIGINRGIMIKSEPTDTSMEVESTSQRNSQEFINYEFLETKYSPKNVVENAVPIATRNDEPIEDRPNIKVEKIKQENEDTFDEDSLPSVHFRHDLSSNVTPASSDVEMSEVDNRSDVIVREAAVQHNHLFDDGESSCFSESDDDSDFDNASRFSDDEAQSDSILFARPTTSHSNRDLGEKALETLQRQQELTMDRLQDLHGSLVSRPSDTDRVEDPPGLFTPLMLHQQQALAWLLWREQQKPPGGILADDMGLGKTLTMISLVLARYKVTQRKKKEKLRRRFVKRRGGTLVVCPASLLEQWQNEIFDHCTPGTLTVGLYHGNKRELSVKKLAKKDIIITTYSILAHAVNHYDRNALFRIHWDRVILDEAHVIRNHKTRMCEAVCELVTDNRWALTGTPIHNKQMDLYSILKFLRCSPFDDLKIWRRWVDNRDEAGYRRLTTLMKTLMLRRTKKELSAKKMMKPLPDKLSQIIPIELDPDERVIYEKVMIYSRTLFRQFLHQRAEKKRQMALGAGYYRPAQDYLEFEEFNDAQKMLLATHADIQTTEILVLLTRLRQICCHPSLIHAMLDREDVQRSAHNNPILNFDLLNKINTFQQPEIRPPAESTADAITNGIEIENLDEEEIGISKRVTENLLTRNNPVFDKSRISSKHRAVLERVKEIIQNGNNDKIIIVSQWTSHLKIIAENLEQIEGATYKTFDGKVPVKRRQQIINELNTPEKDPKILLLSLTAGGVGLNLVGANHLMLVDIHWNPQLETQAQDRIYRFGQKKHVYIYRFICTDSIEERIKNLQEYKLDIAHNVLTGTGRVSTNLTLEDLKTLFGL